MYLHIQHAKCVLYVNNNNMSVLKIVGLNVNKIVGHLKAIPSVFLVLVFLSLFEIIAILVLPSLTAGVKALESYLAFHTMLEMASIIISTLVFMVVWNTSDSERPKNILLLGVVFIGVAMLDFMHTMSFKGMPTFITESGYEKGINFWLAARMLSALGMLAIAFLPWDKKSNDASKWPLMLSVCAFVLFYSWIVIMHPQWLPHTFIEGQGLTQFKRIFEYVIIVCYVIAAIGLFHQINKKNTHDIAGLFVAVSVMALSEFYFTVYFNVADTFNLLGHIYKVIAYTFICYSVFIDSVKKPYLRMDESKKLLQSVIEAIPSRVFWKDKDSRYIGCNTSFAHDAGETSVENIIGKIDDELNWHQYKDSYRNDDLMVMETLAPKIFYDEKIVDTDGKEIWVRTSKVPLQNANNEVVGILGVYDDISKLKQAEFEQYKFTRALKLLSECNSLLVHTKSEKEILQDICNLAIDVGGYSMAWVGLKRDNPQKTIELIAAAGNENGYLQSVNITWDDSASSLGPTGTAIKTAKTSIAQDFLNNENTKPWQIEAAKRGYKATIALPLISNDEVFGVLSIYSTELNAFIPDEVQLLEEMASDLAFGIKSLRTSAAHDEAQLKIEYLAYHDALTELPNRLLVFDRFQQAIAHATRENKKVALCFLDIDNFKQVNDTLGHHIGDKLLIEVAQRIKATMRDIDTVSRHGGDEFIVLLTDIEDLSSLEKIAQKLINSFTQPYFIDDQSLNVSLSIGISVFPDDGDTFNIILKNSDTALYQAKDSGKNDYRLFCRSMSEGAAENIALQSQLYGALQNNEFLLHYQPQLDLHTNKVTGAEALLRWMHPTLGLVPPYKFIPLAERNGMIVSIGEWVMNEACSQAAKWNKDNTLNKMRVAVNLSSLQFRRGNIIQTVENALEKSGLPAELLELELTESILLNDLEMVMTTLDSLRKVGVKISIDDFGTGYSSLSYLKKLAVDRLKIDRSFVCDMIEDSDDAAIVKAVTQLGHTLQLIVIAEGVENQEQLTILKNLGCDEIQGYFFCKPLPADELNIFLAKLPVQQH